MKKLSLLALAAAASLTMIAAASAAPAKSGTTSKGAVLTDAKGMTPVSYTHLTLPTNREV